MQEALKPVGTTKLLVIIMISIWLVTAITLSSIYGPLSDEKNFHLPTVVVFQDKTVSNAINDPAYGPANTPLPYIITAFLLNGHQPEITILRLLSLFLSVLTLVLIYLLLKVLNPQQPLWLPLLLILLQPYFYKSTFTFYMAVYGLLFALAALVALLYMKDTFMAYLVSGIAVAFAILCQQFYLVLPAVFLIIIVLRKNDKRTLHKVINVLIFLLPLVLPLLLFYSWGGITHPRYQPYAVSGPGLQAFLNNIPPANFTAILAICGFYLFPLTIMRVHQLKLSWIATAAVASLLLAVFNSPEYSSSQGFNQVTGLVYRLLNTLYITSPFVKTVAESVLVFSGLTSVYSILALENNSARVIIKLTAAGLFIVLMLNSLLSERHLVSLVVFLLLMVPAFALPKKMLVTWVVLFAILSNLYAYNWFITNQ